MHYDEVLKVVGEFGRYQKVKVGLICLLALTNAWQVMVSVFSIYTPPHRCSLSSGLVNGTATADILENFAEDTWMIRGPAHQLLVEEFIPITENGRYSSCEVYTTPKLSVNHTPEAKQCDSWVYDDTEMVTTVITRMNLVCGNSLYSTIATSMYMFGNLAGAISCGIFADMFGRRIVTLTAVIGYTASGVGLALTPEYYSYAFFRFTSGAFAMQVFLCSFIMAIELVGPSYPPIAGAAVALSWNVGFVLLVGIACLIRLDTYIQLAITLPSLFFICYYWLLPESARWLLVKSRNADAEKIIQDIAKANGKLVPADVKLELEQVKTPESIKELSHAPMLLCRTVIIFFNWFVISTTYYGLSLNSGNMPGSAYVNATFSAVAGIIGNSLSLLCFILGRKKLHVGSLVTAGLACISAVAVYYLMDVDENAKNWTFIILTNIGKIGATLGFDLMHVWGSELFPTRARNTLIGICSFGARMGSIASPYIADLSKLTSSKYGHMIAPLTFGILTICGGLLSLTLPETTGHDLPETIAEANSFPRKPENNTDKANDKADKTTQGEDDQRV